MLSLPVPPEPAGLVLRPLRAVRYDPAHIGDLSHVVGPPPDGAPEETDPAVRISPLHASRLLYAADPRVAGRTLRRWAERGVVRRDAEPAIYLYEQRAAGQVLQRALIAEATVPCAGSGRLTTHEGVRMHEVRRQCAVMAGLGGQLEPLLITCRPRSDAWAHLVEQIAGRPELSLMHSAGIDHRLWAVTDPEEQAVLAADVADVPGFVADGHHRLAAARALTQAQPAGPWGSVLVQVVDTTTYPLTLSAIHRVVAGLDADKAAASAARVADVRRMEQGARPPAADEIVLSGQGRAWSVRSPHAPALRRALSGKPAQWHTLPVAVADHLLIEQAFYVDDLPGAVRHVHGAAQAIAATATVGAGTAVLVPPVDEDTVRALASQGVLLPRKSTAFGPKPSAGLVMRVWDDSSIAP